MGRPGGGKTLDAARDVWHWLLHDTRPIITNVPFIVPAIQQRLDEEERYDVDLSARLLVLRPEPVYRREIRYNEYRDFCQQFYRVRRVQPGRPQLEALPPEGAELDFAKELHGRIFVIDEVAKLWPSQQSMAIGKEVRFLEYLAEHRHFGDDVVFITQHLKQVSDHLKRVAQDYCVCRNRFKETYKIGPTKARGSGFRRTYYLAPPGPSVTPVDEDTFQPDQRLFKLYSTSLKGGKADIGQRAKGAPVPLVIGGGVGLAIIAFALFTQVPGAALSAAFGQTERPVPSQTDARQSGEAEDRSDQAEVQALQVDALFLEPRGRGTFAARLSDGTYLREDSPGVEGMEDIGPPWAPRLAIVYRGQLIPESPLPQVTGGEFDPRAGVLPVPDYPEWKPAAPQAVAQASPKPEPETSTQEEAL